MLPIEIRYYYCLNYQCSRFVIIFGISLSLRLYLFCAFLYCFWILPVWSFLKIVSTINDSEERQGVTHYSEYSLALLFFWTITNVKDILFWNNYYCDYCYHLLLGWYHEGFWIFIESFNLVFIFIYRRRIGLNNIDPNSIDGKSQYQYQIRSYLHQYFFKNYSDTIIMGWSIYSRKVNYSFTDWTCIRFCSLQINNYSIVFVTFFNLQFLGTLWRLNTTVYWMELSVGNLI